LPAQFVVQGKAYRLTAEEVRTLERDGMLRGRTSSGAEYLLMYCVNCHALFGTIHTRDQNNFLYYPYELFAVCPHCKAVEWCLFEEVREEQEKKYKVIREQDAKNVIDALKK
jgi:hypothetical protein